MPTFFRFQHFADISICTELPIVSAPSSFSKKEIRCRKDVMGSWGRWNKEFPSSRLLVNQERLHCFGIIISVTIIMIVIIYFVSICMFYLSCIYNDLSFKKMIMQRPRATWPSRKDNSNISALRKNSGKLIFLLHCLIEKFSLFYFKCVRLR